LTRPPPCPVAPAMIVSLLDIEQEAQDSP